MISIALDAAAVGRVRVAVSPAVEALTWLRLASGGWPHPLFGKPGPSARFALRDPDVRLVAGVLAPHPRGYAPDFLTPKPLGGPDAVVLSDQLHRLAEVAPERVERSMRKVAAPSREALAAVEDGTFARRAAAGLDRFWRDALADTWSGLAERLAADLRQRAVTVATQGVGALLGSLHTRVRWTGSAIEVDKPSVQSTLALTGQDLVVSPSALVWPLMWMQVDDPEDVVVVVPAHGLGEPVPRLRGLDRLIGPTRARLLADLDVPRSTQQLAARHGLAPATVSHHLSVLHGSGHVTRERVGRSVLYQRTYA